MKRTALAICAGVVLLAFPVSTFADQVSDLQSQIAQEQQQATSLQGQANTLANQVASLNAQIAAAEDQINLTQLKSEQVQAQIVQTQAQMASQKAILADTIKQMYLESDQSTLEILASSNSLSDFFNKQQYQDTVKSKVQDDLAALLKSQQQLTAESQQVAALLVTQKAANEVLANQQAQVQQLLSSTQGQEANYQAQAAANQKELNQVIAARAAAVKSGSLDVSGGGCGPYPNAWCGATQDTVVTDGNYWNRECTSYVAYRRESTGHGLPSGWGNATDWAAHANTTTPQAGDIVVWQAGSNAYIAKYNSDGSPGDGHVAYIESVSGGNITVSQYNFNTGGGWGFYSTMVIHPGDVMYQGMQFVQ